MELGMFTTCMTAMQQWDQAIMIANKKAVHGCQQKLLRRPQEPHSAVMEEGRCGYHYHNSSTSWKEGVTFSYLMIFVMKFLG